MDALTITDPDGDRVELRDLTHADKGTMADDEQAKKCKAALTTKTEGDEHEIWLTLDAVADIRDWCNGKLAAAGYARAA